MADGCHLMSQLMLWAWHCVMSIIYMLSPLPQSREENINAPLKRCGNWGSKEETGLYNQSYDMVAEL